MSIQRREVLKLGALAAAVTLAGAGRAQSSTATPGETRNATRKLSILILGGTGLTGPHQVAYALSRGHEVTLFNRGRKQREWPGSVEQRLGDRDINDYKSLAAEVAKGRRWDLCIDNPSSVPHWIRDAAAVLKGHVGGYMMISSLSAYADNATPSDDETAALAIFDGDPLKETMASLRADMGKYAGLKAATEVETLKHFGSTATIVRPGLIVGPGDETDRFTYWPMRLAKGGEVLAPGDGRDPIKYIDARDLGEWMIRLGEAGATGAFNAIGPAGALDMAGLLYGIRASTTANAPLTWVPAGFLEAQQVSPWGDMPVWVPGQGETAGFHTRSNAKAVAAGLTFRSLADTVAATQAWFAAQPEERRNAPLRSGIKPEREAEVLAAWKAQAAKPA